MPPASTGGRLTKRNDDIPPFHFSDFLSVDQNPKVFNLFILKFPGIKPDKLQTPQDRRTKSQRS
jgi:hypothetical protein